MKLSENRSSLLKGSSNFSRRSILESLSRAVIELSAPKGSRNISSTFSLIPGRPSPVDVSLLVPSEIDRLTLLSMSELASKSKNLDAGGDEERQSSGGVPARLSAIFLGDSGFDAKPSDSSVMLVINFVCGDGLELSAVRT